jgi:hypothetical protein
MNGLMTTIKQDRKDISFPDCSTGCLCVEYFGVCECESICPHKFDKNGNAISGN